IVGNTGGKGIPSYHVTVRNSNGSLLEGPVTLDFSRSKILLRTDQPGVDCAAKTITSSALLGVATFAPHFGGFDNTKSIAVRAGGVLLGYIDARSTDLNGRDNTDVIDLSIFLSAQFRGEHRETDFNLDGVTDPNDMSLLLSAVNNSAGGYCP